MEREAAAARRRLDREMPALKRRLEQCQATPDASGRQLRELAALGALAEEPGACGKALRKAAASGRPKLDARREKLRAAIDGAKSQSDTLEQRLQAAVRGDSKLGFLAAQGAPPTPLPSTSWTAPR